MEPKLPDLKLLRRCWPGYEDRSTTHRVKVKDVEFGGPTAVVIAGPCAVESLDKTLRVARVVSRAGARLLRGGAFKPRTSPHTFQGLGEKGLEVLEEVREQTGLGIVTEVMDTRLVERVAETADMLQIGSRSMQNFPLLREVGRTNVPVLLKRGWRSTLEEWICAAEYIANEGNDQIVLCERGIRTCCHWEYARNLLDLNVIEPMRRITPLPVIVDPSHAAGNWQLVATLGRAAIVAGAHGLLVEVGASEDDRPSLRSDAHQGIPPEELEELIRWVNRQSTVSSDGRGLSRQVTELTT